MSDSGVSAQLIAAFGTSNPYEILEVAREASEEDIKKAYRRAALKNHPDKGMLHHHGTNARRIPIYTTYHTALYFTSI